VLEVEQTKTHNDELYPLNEQKKQKKKRMIYNSKHNYDKITNPHKGILIIVFVSSYYPSLLGITKDMMS
jgi:hypothetical protein